MSRRGGYRAGTTALGVLGMLSAISVVVAAVTIGVADRQGEAAELAGRSVLDSSVLDSSVLESNVAGPAAAVTDQVSGAAQRQAVTHWTRQRMRGATAASLPRSVVRTAVPVRHAVTGTPAVTRAPAGPAVPAVTRAAARPGRPRARRGGSLITAPKGTPTAAPFSGSPTTGVLFYTTGGKGHFCTASVVDSTADDLALTAAHCVYSKGFATNIEYVPGYHDGKQPYGVWPVRTITVASGWKLSHDPDLDFAFLTLASIAGRPIQARTGGLTIGFTRWNSEKIEAIGHNDSEAEPIRCATRSFRFRTGQMEFYCHGFWTGTSGGPWIIGYDAKNGTGTVFGVIGGYELGGDYEWASYSAYFGSAAKLLFEQVERTATPRPTPTPSAAPTASSAAPTASSASPTTSASPTASASPTTTGPDTAYPKPTAPAPPAEPAPTGTAPPGTGAPPGTAAASPSPTGPVSSAYRGPILPG